MVYFWDYIIDYFIYSETGKYILSFIFLYLFFFIAISISGVFEGKKLNKIKAILSLAMSIIALYNPYTKEMIFNIISNMTSLLLIFFGLIVVLYMACKVIIHPKMKEDIVYEDTLRKIQKYALYVFLGLAVLGGMYLIMASPFSYKLVPPWIIDYMTATLPKIVILGIIGGLLYYIVLRPIIKEAKGEEKRKKLERIKELIKAKEQGKLEANVETFKNLAKELSPEERAILASEYLKEKKREE